MENVSLTGLDQPAQAPAPAAQPSRKIFWFFAAAMGVAVLGGGAIAFRARQAQQEQLAQQKALQEQLAQQKALQEQLAQQKALQEQQAQQKALQEQQAQQQRDPSTPTPDPQQKVTTQKKVPPKHDPAKALALYKKGQARQSEQDIDGAIKLYLAAEAIDPDLAEVQKRLGVCYQLQGQTKKAASRYRKYLATQPADAERVKVILSTLE
jgi:tetratricopeptide (TPR) repeat protein